MANDNINLLKAIQTGDYNSLKTIIQQLFVRNSVVYTNYDRIEVRKAYSDNDAVFSAINKIAWAVKNIRIVPVKVGTNEEITTNDMAIFAKKALLERFCVEYGLFGESFVYTPILEAGNNKGKVIKDNVVILPAESVEIKANNPFDITGYVIEGLYSTPLPSEEVLHIKNVNPDWKDLHGLSFVKVAGKQIDKINSADETEVKNFQNGGPSYVASPRDEYSNPQDEYKGLIDRLKRMWKDPKNKGGLVGTNVGLTLTKVGATPIDMGTLESRKNAVKSLCAVWNLDPGIFDTDASTYENKETMLRALYTQAAIPIATTWIEAINEKFSKVYGAELILDLSGIDALKKNVGELIKSMKQVQCFTDDEIREAAGYEQLPDETGSNVWKNIGEVTLEDAINGDSNGSNEPIMS